MDEPIVLGGEELIQEDFKKAVDIGEEELLRQKEENLKVMMEERNRQRLNKIGNYKIAEKIDEIYHLGLCNVDFCGEVFEADTRITKKGSKMGTFSLGDPSNAISFRCFGGSKIPDEKIDGIKVGDRLRVRGAIDMNCLPCRCATMTRICRRNASNSICTRTCPRWTPYPILASITNWPNTWG